MNEPLTESPLQYMQRRLQKKEEIFFYGMIVSFIAAIAAAILIKEQWRVASIEIIFLSLTLILFFCRNRASNCVNSLGFAIHLETKDFSKALTILKSSDCIKNADAFVGLLAKSSFKAAIPYLACTP